MLTQINPFTSSRNIPLKYNEKLTLEVEENVLLKEKTTIFEQLGRIRS